MSLSKESKEPAYLLGRLFAVYELIQERAADRKLNRTIRDAFFGAAMASPKSVFSRLARLNQVHLRELKRANEGAGSYFGRLLLEITEKMSADTRLAFPASSTPDQQGSFVLGYYHQREDVLASNTKQSVNETEKGN